MVDVEVTAYHDAGAEIMALSLIRRNCFGAGIELDAVNDLLAALTPEHFFDPTNRAFFQAMAHAVHGGGGAQLVHAWLRQNGFGQLADRSDEIRSTWEQWFTFGSFRRDREVDTTLRQLNEKLAARRLREACEATVNGLDLGSDPVDVRSRLTDRMSDLFSGWQPGPPADMIRWHDVPGLDDSSGEIIIPGLMARDTRLMFVGAGGSGKSFLMAQIALLASQGIHPFGTEPNFTPIRTLTVDAENPVSSAKARWWRSGQQLTSIPGYDPDRAVILRRPAGMNLRSSEGYAELAAAIRHHRPDLVAVGPLYKLSRRQKGENDEASAEAVTGIFDELRVRYGFGLIIETHAPWGEAGSRVYRPFGSSVWERWPELGFGLRPAGPDGDKYSVLEVESFRGERTTFDWPKAIQRVKGGMRSWLPATL